MFIEQIQLYDFRNYEQKSFDFTESRIVFYGPNGQGKTNILEALSILSVGKSWRETRPADLIRTEEISAKIEAKLSTQDAYKILIEPRSRQFFKNEKKISLKRHFGKIATLLFCPEFLHLFSGSKSERLKFFDRFLIQIAPLYREALLKAQKAHRQKTRLLRSDITPTKAEIQPWNRILCEAMPVVIQERQCFLKAVNPLLQSELEKISQKFEPVKIHYAMAEKFTPTEEGLSQFLEKISPREIAAQKNFLAPGRDDFLFYLRDQPILQTASRGEERSVLLAFLSAQKYYLKNQHQENPILLLDDVFSELDDDRQKHLEHLCEGSQVFFTTTHQEHFRNFSGEIQKVAVG